MLREQRRQLETLQEAVDKIQQEQRRSGQTNIEKALPEIPTVDQVTEQAKVPAPPSEEQPWPLPPGGPGKTNLLQHPKLESRIIGEISVLSNPSSVTEEISSRENKKKAGRCICLLPLWRRSC